MPDDSIRLFVYGTLMPGGYYYPRIQPYVRSWQPATIPGALVDVGWYPALVLGRGVVRGVLLELNESALPIADHIEKYTPGQTDSEYLRKQVTACVDDPSSPGRSVEVTAWTYEFAEPHRLSARPHLVVARVDGRPIYAWAMTTQPDPQRLK